MSMDGNGLSVADALALGRDNDGMFGDGNGSWIFFLFFLLAWGGNFGNWGGNGMNSTASAYTDSAIQRGFDNQAVNFKTSHVIVYRYMGELRMLPNVISKHLMLLFIFVF